MASRRRPREVTSPRSLEPIQGIPLQGSLYMDDLPMECLHFEESYATFQDRHVEVEHPIDLHVF